MMVKINIDSRLVEAEDNATIIEAAAKAGIHIPTLCYHESLKPAGNCRICTVEVVIDGVSSLTAACNYPVVEGLKVITDSEGVIRARKLALELLMAQQPHSLEIRKLAGKFGVVEPGFTLKQRECILCELCVRACQEMVEARAITFIAQGIGRNVEEPTVEHSWERCIGCDTCAWICPTEAITVEDVVDTRKLSTPSGILEFKLKQCRVCGKYWATEKELDYIVKKWNIEPELFETCPDCRD